MRRRRREREEEKVRAKQRADKWLEIRQQEKLKEEMVNKFVPFLLLMAYTYTHVCT